MSKEEKMKVVIISGLSGAGKTHAADWFEDHGYYCIDNMPPALIKSFLDLAMFRTIRMTKAAFVVDIRSDEFFSGLNDTIDYLRMREDIEFSILFIEASDSTLIRRYNETRRNHPLSTGRTSKEVIEKERSMLADLRARANHVLDTTNLKVAQFNLEMSKNEVAQRIISAEANIPLAAMRRAAERYPDAVLAVGNAPTALFQIADEIEAGLRPALVVAVPVGFVNVVESKERIVSVCKTHGVPVIAAMGRKGGSSVAAAIMNALIYTASDMLDPAARGWR